MQDFGLVSIITPSHNCGEYIVDTIKSVMAQSYENWELIICDDCSTDNTKGVLSPFLSSCSKIKYICNEKNSGAAVSRNNALREANGKWIAFLDADDLWSADKLEKQLDFMVRNNYHFSYTGYSEINADGESTGVSVSGPKRVTKFGMLAFATLLFSTLLLAFAFSALTLSPEWISALLTLTFATLTLTTEWVSALLTFGRPEW